MRRWLNAVFHQALGSCYLALCQHICNAIPACVGIFVYPGEQQCWLNGEGMKSADKAAAESFTKSLKLSLPWGFVAYTGTGGIAGTTGSIRHPERPAQCYKKI